MSITFHYQIFVCFIAKVKYDWSLRTYRKETIQVFYKLRFIVLTCSECLKRLRCRNFRKFLENGFLNFIPFWVRFCKQLGWYLPKICHVRFHRLFNFGAIFMSGDIRIILLICEIVKFVIWIISLLACLFVPKNKIDPTMKTKTYRLRLKKLTMSFDKVIRVVISRR